MFRYRRKQSDFDAELEAHIALEADRLKEQGLSEQEARAAARRAFGNVNDAQERFYESTHRRWCDELRQDVRYGFRQLRRNPGFALIAILTLALGIGANAVIFSAVNSVLLRPLPYPNSSRLAQVWSTNPHTNRWGDWASYPDFVDWRTQNKAFEGLAAYRTWLTNITGGDHPEALFTVLASSSLFSVLQSQPVLGRSFLPDEDKPGHNHVVVLSDILWRRRFGSDPHLVGKAVVINGERYLVIGIMSPRFRFPPGLSETFAPSAWLPLGLDSSQSDRGSHNYRVAGGLGPALH